MGVPAFYRWISEKYPKIVVNVLERRPRVIDGQAFPVDLNEPNPNGVEFDNLFVDMNGLIHPCSHPEDREAPKTEEEMYLNVTKYIDRLVAAIRPRQLLFLAIDGVAPRAKMNQQRSRRFRAAQEAKEKKEMMDEVLAEMADEGFDTSLKKSGADWDSNVITPGTEFMTKISNFLRHYILERMNNDRYWKNLTVILSDASQPGEGEHKIMDFIRSQRNQPGYNPNTHHVLHGLDADLIMLALATHEVRFTILREKVFFGKKGRDSEDDVSPAQRLLDAQSMRNGEVVLCADPKDEWVFGKPLQALHIHTLRHYLDVEFSILKSTLPFPYDLERIIDDFIFMCFFVGNDFLPHLPSLDIRDGALDFLLECYKDVLPSLGSYVTSPGGIINLSQADVLLSRVGEVEDQIFLRKKRAEDNSERKFQQRRQHQQYHQQQQQNSSNMQRSQSEPYEKKAHVHAGGGADSAVQRTQSSADNNAAASALREKLLGKRRLEETTIPEDASETKVSESNNDATVNEEAEAKENRDEDWDPEEEEEIEDLLPVNKKVKRELSEEEIKKAKEELKARIKTREQQLIDKYKVTVEDGVKLHEAGWKDRYYAEPHKKHNLEEGGGLQRMCVTYVQGLCWVMRYYYHGVPSWNWYYPFHYAPFASDLVNIDRYGSMSFVLSQPFRPIEQLLAVLPASSAAALPEECQWLMLDTVRSPIADIYDDDVPIDPNGKHLPWLWILLLPFIDESRVVAAFDLCRANLTLQSRRRNSLGPSVIFVHSSRVLGAYARQKSEEVPALLQVAPEKDPDVVAALQQLRQEGLLTDEEAPGISSTSTGEGADAILVPFECNESEGICGILGPAPIKYYAPLHAPVRPPLGTESWFKEVRDNQVFCLQFQLPSADRIGVHRSAFLAGAEEPPSVLGPNDLQPRRPPRLNKSGFNVLELFQSVRGGGAGGGSGDSYQANQQYRHHNNSNGRHQQQHSQQGGYDGYQQHVSVYDPTLSRGYNNYSSNSYHNNNSYNNRDNNYGNSHNSRYDSGRDHNYQRGGAGGYGGRDSYRDSYHSRDNRDGSYSNRDGRDSSYSNRDGNYASQHRGPAPGSYFQHSNNQVPAPPQQHYQQQQPQQQQVQPPEFVAPDYVPQITRLGGGFGQAPQTRPSSTAGGASSAATYRGAAPSAVGGGAGPHSALSSYKQQQMKKHAMPFHSGPPPAQSPYQPQQQLPSQQQRSGFRFNNPAQQQPQQMYGQQQPLPSLSTGLLFQQPQFSTAPGGGIGAAAGSVAGSSLEAMRAQMLQTLNNRQRPNTSVAPPSAFQQQQQQQFGGHRR